MKTTLLTAPALATVLERRRGAEFASLTVATRPRLRKTGRDSGAPCPVHGLLKVSRISVVIGFRYGNSVQNQRDREDIPEPFEAKERSWGTHRGGCLIEHNGNTYLEVKVEKSLEHTYYDDLGQEWTGDDLAEWLPKRKDSGRQGTEKAVILRDYNLENIREIRIGGEVLRLA